MADTNKEKNRIDIRKIWQTMWNKRLLFLKVWVVTFVLACLWILPQPRYYTTSVSISPETGESKVGGGLASLATNFGMNLGGSSTGDAIYPQLYPELFKSTNFLVGLLDVQVRTKDGSVETDYYTYLKDYQKATFWVIPFIKFKNWISSLFAEPETVIPASGGKRFDPFRLSVRTTEILEAVKGSVHCTYSRTTDVVTITVTDQDPLVCGLLADSVKKHLQVFITDYRTKKARTDCEYYSQLLQKAKDNYEKARKDYASYADANQNVMLESVKSKIEDLNNEMQLKYNAYTGLNSQLQSAMSRLQERTPAFTTLTNATVPVKPAGPKRMIFVAAMLFLSTIGTFMFLFRKELKEWF